MHKVILNIQMRKETYLTQDVDLIERFRIDIAHDYITSLHRKLSNLNCMDKEIVGIVVSFIKS